MKIGFGIILVEGINDSKLLIRGSKDGFEAKDFHNKFYDKNITVIFIGTSDDRRFEGFTGETLDQSNEWKKARKSFIF